MTKSIIKRKTGWTVALAVMGILLLSHLPIFPFMPVFNIKRCYRDQEWCRMPFILTENELEAVIRTLTEGSEQVFYFRSGKKILIPFRLFVDTEMLGNYTAKAGLACPDSSLKMDSYGLWVETRD